MEARGHARTKLKHFETISAPTKIKHPSTPHIQMSFYFSNLFLFFSPTAKQNNLTADAMLCTGKQIYTSVITHTPKHNSRPTCSLSPFYLNPDSRTGASIFKKCFIWLRLKPHESSVRHVQHIHFLQFAAYSCQSCHYIATTEMSSCYSKLASWYV